VGVRATILTSAAALPTPWGRALVEGLIRAAGETHARLAVSTKLAIAYVAMTSIHARMLDRELKKGSAELIILSVVEARARHGYEISKLIETRSAGQLKFHVASLYPLLYRLEERGWLQGRWVEKAGQRRRRFYSLTAEGRRVLARQRDTWRAFVHAMGLVTGVDHA
jgi:PadR family transcriptional regulator PadR